MLAAFVMWAFWILAYVVGLSNHDFYRNFHHVAGGLSAAADQQIASAVLWFVAAVTFVPVIFWNALMWLKTEEDPDAELLALARAERRRGTPPAAGVAAARAQTPLTRPQPPLVRADAGEVDRLEGGCRGRFAASSCADRFCCGLPPAVPPPSPGVQRRRVVGVVHQGLDVLDHSQGVRRGPQQRGATIWPRCLPAGVPGTWMFARS